MAKLSEESFKDSSVGRDQGGVCSVCHVQNKRGPNDRMVGCRECSNKGEWKNGVCIQIKNIKSHEKLFKNN